MSWSSLFPQWLGGTQGLTAATGALGGTINDPNLGPTGWSSSGEAQWNPTTATSSGAVGGKEVASALSSAAGKSGSSSSSSDSSTKATSRDVQSQLGKPANAANLSNLLQLLNQRTNMYLGATNPQSAQPQQTQNQQRGLLGL